MLEGIQICLVASGIAWIDKSQIRSHVFGDQPCILRSQPEVGIQCTGSMKLVMIIDLQFCCLLFCIMPLRLISDRLVVMSMLLAKMP